MVHTVSQTTHALGWSVVVSNPLVGLRRLGYSGMRKALAGVAIGVLLSGCLAEQKDQIEKCRIEGKELALSVFGKDWKEDSLNSSAQKYVMLCMKAREYEWSWHGNFCQPMFDGSEIFNPYCYRPQGAVLSFLTDVEIAKNGGFDDWFSQLWCKRMKSYTAEYCSKHGWFPN